MVKIKDKSSLIELKKYFSDKEMFEQALTHRSWVNENPGIRQSNERLEFLGDAVLEFVVSDYLFKRLENREEGFLTALRANIVNTKNLSELAKTGSFGDFLHFSKGEKISGGSSNPALLANTVEAIIGALYLDKGLGAAEKFIVDNLLSDLEKKLEQPLKDPKSLFQEKVQSMGFDTPKYKVLSESGPDHAKRFEVEVTVNGKTAAQGQGKSKNEAEQDAARNALDTNFPA